MKMEWSGLRLGRMGYEMNNWTCWSQSADIKAELSTGDLGATSVMLDSRLVDAEDAERFHAWLTENRDRTFKVTLELDDEDDDEEEERE